MVYRMVQKLERTPQVVFFFVFFLAMQSNKEELVRWEEGKKWQARMEKVRSLLKDKEKETESLSKQLTTLKELYGRSYTQHSRL